jgi:hypothetical protein
MLTESPPALTQLRRGIAPRVSTAVQQALAMEPADRFATATAASPAFLRMDPYFTSVRSDPRFRVLTGQ